MLLAQISSWISQATRFRLAADQIIVIMDAAQRMAFDTDAKAFLYWGATLTPNYNITFLSAGYTNAVVGDIGKTVVQGANTGTLISYNNTTRVWVVSTTTNWTDGGTVTITTGTGAGTLIASASQTGYVGPYAWPTTVPVNKMWGVTAETDVRIFGSDVSTTTINDFDFLPILFNPKELFKPARMDVMAQTFTFIDSPALPASLPVYRWVYWRNPPTIDGTDDETELLIPAVYHMNFINACVALAEITLSGANVDPNQIKSFFKPWWDSLMIPYTPMGKGSNGTQNPGQSSTIMI